MANFSWLQIVKAILVIAAWLLNNSAKNEAKAAGVHETLSRILQEANDAIDKAKAARDRVIAELDAHPERLRDADEFQRRDARPESTKSSDDRPE